MTKPPPISFNALVEHHLGARLPSALAGAINFPALSTDAQALIRRMLRLMKSARFPIIDFNLLLVRMLATMVPGVLPGSWGGRIPPLTVPGRHRKLDAYVAAQNYPPAAPSAIYADLGCGFPPVTTADTARALPDWQVCGVDRFFAAYVVYDREGHYACFDGRGRYRYFQAQMTRRGLALYEDPAATRKHFEALFDALFPGLPKAGDGAVRTIAQNGQRLVSNPIREFETRNLTFLESDIEALELPPAQVVRCMNVLLYFAPPARTKMLRQIGALLAKGGLLIAGTSGFGIDARYTVFREASGTIIPSEFAFSIENLRSFGIMPYFTIHEGDREAALLADLMGAIRVDPSFGPALNNRVDALLAQRGIGRRGPDGYLRPPPEEMPHGLIRDKMAAMWRQLAAEGFLEGAVEALARAGYDAWTNAAGDIAIRPPADYHP